MKTKNVWIMINVLSLILFFSCKGSSKDPSTSDLGEFNPPGALQTLTRDSKLVLTWVAANAEKDFQGYHVFGVKGSLADIIAETSPTFPTGVDLTKSMSLPRCKDNSKFFEKFGFPATDKECKTTEFTSAASNTTTPNSNQTPSSFAQRQFFLTAEEMADDEKIDFNIACVDSEGNALVSDKSLSYAATEGKTIGRVFCEVRDVFDATAETKRSQLVNGTTYTFFVVAVKGDKKNEISWISNVVQDTPAHTLFAKQIKLSKENYVVFDLDYTNFSQISDPTAQSCNTQTLCSIVGPNDDNSNPNGIYLARDKTGSSGKYSQRLLVSVSNQGKINLLHRGPEVWQDPSQDNKVIYQKPGDQASSDFSSATAGTVYPVYGNQVFDIKVSVDASTTYYGKFAVTDLSYETESKDADSLIDVTIVLQPQAGSADYFYQSTDLDF